MKPINHRMQEAPKVFKLVSYKSKHALIHLNRVIKTNTKTQYIYLTIFKKSFTKIDTKRIYFSCLYMPISGLLLYQCILCSVIAHSQLVLHSAPHI